MLKVVELHTPNADWNDSVQRDMIDTLENWLVEAKAGKFDAMAFCGVLKDEVSNHARAR